MSTLQHPDSEELSQSVQSKVIFALMLGTFLAIINSSTINIALTTFMREFSTDLTTVQWIVVGYMLATGLVTPLVGFWGDQFSYQRILAAGLVMLGVTSIACGLAVSVEMLIVFRVIQGIAGGIIMPAAMTLVYQFIYGQRQVMAMACVSMALSAGIAIGPSLAGVLLNFWGWRAIFWFNIPLLLIDLYFVWRYIPIKIIGQGQRLDYKGLLAVIIGTVGILMGFNKGADWGWTSPKTIGLVSAGVAAMIYFVVHELRIQRPMLNFRVFCYSKFTSSLMMNSSMAIATCLSPYFMPLFLQNVMGLDALHAGVVLLFPSLVMALASPIAGKLGQRFALRPIIFFSMLVLLGSTFELSRFTLETTVLAVSLWLSLRYAGIGIMAPLLNDFAMASVPESLLGHASAMMGWTRQLISTLSTSIFTFIYSARIVSHLQSGLGAELGSEQMRYVYCMSINDITFYSLLILIACVPIIYFFKCSRSVEE